MNEYKLKDDLLVECESCKTDIPAKVSELENDNSVVCPNCGTGRTVNMGELHQQFETMLQTLREMHGAGEATDDNEKN